MRRSASLALALLLLGTAPDARMRHGHGADGTGHDAATMPGLRGPDAAPRESAGTRVLFDRFTDLTRSVETLPGGIRTVTILPNPMVMDALVSHVTGMIARVEESRARRSSSRARRATRSLPDARRPARGST